MLKNFLRQSSIEESRRSTFASKIDRSGREANVACVIACIVCSGAREEVVPFFFSGKFCRKNSHFSFRLPFELFVAIAIACALPYLLKVFVCFELFRISLFRADLT
ncbi:unnamed protein product [Cercopithifilaria johnstoni]|uniref:Uncharacterized protein n=1 Tax=Cercopithifilaria johnstoni TaxID=2874296 RepID=A0A8J2LZY2_9BILA|nr:unnamed protein product [Cercopithifilaria johnstoni]